MLEYKKYNLLMNFMITYFTFFEYSTKFKNHFFIKLNFEFDRYIIKKIL